MARLADMIAHEPGILSMVGTPIGNLQDASSRMRETLDRSDVVLCEDTRVTAKLMSAFHLTSKLERCDDNVIASKVQEVMQRLSEGQRVSFVSDAGMPGISDPGVVLVDAALDAGHAVEIIPGPSAVTCALVASGFCIDHFFFEGFLPRKKHAKIKRLQILSNIPGALVIYESPYRVVDTLQALAEVFPSRSVALVRELTKIHEEVVRGGTHDVFERISGRENIKGECVIVVAPPSEQELHSHAEDDMSQTMMSEAVQNAELPSTHQTALCDAIKQGLAQARPKTALARQLSKQFGMSRSDVYDLVCELARSK